MRLDGEQVRTSTGGDNHTLEGKRGKGKTGGENDDKLSHRRRFTETQRGKNKPELKTKTQPETEDQKV